MQSGTLLDLAYQYQNCGKATDIRYTEVILSFWLLSDINVFDE